ncbi:hypothetical protein Mal64_21540 [Pseudobythopirellula maris]|uniref:SEC-C motif protein n=1 Tax=Pseudobythopirellula maris TaxID=2527991 RepID=A0A5C5ZP24_9BACT|nr:tetratricopeptide repeat protein [Pseudobythopirellula maris]TWT88667.1 hypothetical protein Mal64_21540 [Pseudobythopirellula maris]
MSVDPYSPCPCGSGKKLKFCCGDLLGDIEKIHAMVEGDQPRAALKRLEQTLQKAPGRPSLLDLKASIELSIGDHDAAEQTVGQLVEVDPNSPSAHALAAMLAGARAVAPAESGDGQAEPSQHADSMLPRSRAEETVADKETVRQAVDALQRALELIERDLPLRVLEAVGAVGQALLVSGDLIAARAHLWLYQGISGGEDTRAMQLLMRLNQMGGMPLLLRDQLYLRDTPEEHAAEAEHDRAQLLASRGMWRAAAQKLEALCEQHPDEATFVYNHALLLGWLGETDRMVEGFHAYAAALPAEGDSLADDAVETAAIAQLLDRSGDQVSYDVVRVTYAIADEEAVVERLAVDKRLVPHDVDPNEWKESHGPAPRRAYMVLDSPALDSPDGLTLATAPRIMGFLSHYGRRTDREERLVLVTDRDDDFDRVRAIVAEAAGDALGDETETETIDQTPAIERAFAYRAHLPEGATPAMRRELQLAHRRDVILNQWPKLEQTTLAGKSPEAAVGDDTLRLPLAAAMLILEQTPGMGRHAEALRELRGRLSMAEPTPIAPADADPETLPLVRAARLDLTAVSDDTLASLYQRATLAGATALLLRAAAEVVSRPSLAGVVSTDEAFERLISLEDDHERALEWVERARQAAEAQGKSSAPWDIFELELLVMLGKSEEANTMIAHLRDEHLSEPGVPEQLYQLLYSLGAISDDPRDAPGAPPEAGIPSPPQGAEPAGAIWTPDGEAGGAGGSKKLWTPT